MLLLVSRKYFIAAMLLALLVLVLDQASKYAIIQAIPFGRGIAVLPFFNLVHIYNHGISFGLMKGWALPPHFFTLLSIAIVFFLLRWLSRTDDKMVAAALGLVMGGALGNVFDRLLHGAVVDFLDFHLFGWHWPAFNIADSAVVTGALLLILHSLVFDKKSRQ